ncbi:MAG: UbiA family prenyltransferase [Bacteroidetes bacterium]|nr:UbiA family prenyltransferase [Bacteroidota bacterium]
MSRFASIAMVLRGLRPINLILLMLALPSFRYFLMLPVLETRLLNFGLSDTGFALLVLGAGMIAGAGNLINDYFDQLSDRINLKQRQVPSEKVFWSVYTTLNLLGLSLCGWAAWEAGLLNLTLIPLAAVMLLFRYSEHFKGRSWSGPLVIVLLCLLWVALPWLYEFKAMGILYRYYPSDAQYLNQTWLVYLGLVALVTLSRELIKACQDRAGDLAAGLQTVAVVMGLKGCRNIAFGAWLPVPVLNLLVVRHQVLTGAIAESLYSSIALLLALVITYSLYRVQSSNDAARVSLLLKVYLALGIGSLWVYYMLFLYMAP